MKISQKHIQYILLLLIVVIGVCAYQFGYVKYIEKANAVKEENKGIEARINELTEKETHREEWSLGIENSEKEIKTILAKYGPGNTPEKSIMFVRALEDAAEMTIPSIGFNGDNVIYTSNDVNEDGTPKITLNSTYINISYGTTYDGLKKCIDFINNYKERMNVSSFSASYNQENGQLAGNMVINMYGVKDENHLYSEPFIGGIDLGTDNIFGTIVTGTTDLPFSDEENTNEENSVTTD